MRTVRTHPLRALAVAALLLQLLLCAGARAEGSPAITLSVEGPSSLLYGARASVRLNAANPAEQPYGYNLSYRAVLPEGISYVSGSSKANGSSFANPKVIVNAPASGQT